MLDHKPRPRLREIPPSTFTGREGLGIPRSADGARRLLGRRRKQDQPGEEEEGRLAKGGSLHLWTIVTESVRMEVTGIISCDVLRTTNLA